MTRRRVDGAGKTEKLVPKVYPCRNAERSGGLKRRGADKRGRQKGRMEGGNKASKLEDHDFFFFFLERERAKKGRNERELRTCNG